MVCCVSTFLKAPTCRAIRATSSMQSPLLSTIVRARRSVGRHPPRPFKIVYPLQNDGVLRRPVEPKQTAVIGMMDDVAWLALGDRHVQRVEDDVRLEARRHRPSDDAAAPCIEDDGEVQETGPRGHIRDVRDPELVGTARRE